MNFYVIDKVISKPGIVDSFHYRMFHGGQVEPMRKVQPGIAPTVPLRLWKNIYHIAPLFQPHARWVISDEAKTCLANLPHVHFLEVHFTRLFEYPYRAGDFSHWDGGKTWYELEPIIDNTPHEHSLEAGMDRFWELFVPRHMDVHKKYDGLKHFHCGRVALEPVHVGLSAQMLTDYPMLWDGPYILSEAAYCRIERFIDWHYFVRWEGEVS
jgi:hypothetical protein